MPLNGHVTVLKYIRGLYGRPTQKKAIKTWTRRIMVWWCPDVGTLENLGQDLGCFNLQCDYAKTHCPSDLIFPFPLFQGGNFAQIYWKPLTWLNTFGTLVSGEFVWDELFKRGNFRILDLLLSAKQGRFASTRGIYFY